MKREKKKSSIQRKYMLGSFLVAIIPIILCFSYMYQNSMKTIKSTYIESRSRIVSQISTDIEYQVENVNVVIGQLRFNDAVHELLEKSARGQLTSWERQKNALNAVKTVYIVSPILEDMRCTIIQGYNGITIAYEGFSALINMDRMKEAEWFQKGEKTHKISWGFYEKAYNEHASEAYVIPVYFPIEEQYSSGYTGYGVLMFDQSLFEKSFRMLLASNEELYVVNQEGQLVASNRIAKDSHQIPEGRQDIIYQVAELVQRKQDSAAGNLTVSVDGTPCLVTYQHSRKSEWITLELIPMTEYIQLQKMQQRTILLITAVAMLLAFLVSLIAAKTITKPLSQIVKQVENIGQGNFNKTGINSSSQEISILSGSINTMQDSIQRLMQDNRKHEHEQYILEMQMLQSQINPHFLYNTLNNIRLMATMQGMAGIAHMTDALANMMKYALKAAEKPTMIADELAVVNDYIYIQNIRYKGSIVYEVELEDPDSALCILPRFTLQPLIENSIIHGLLASSSEVGKIKVRIRKNEDLVMIEVCDNGKGMSPDIVEQMNERLKTGEIKVGSENGGIGIYNVNRRIQLLCGIEYGLYIESKENEYTKVIVGLKWGDVDGRMESTDC